MLILSLKVAHGIKVKMTNSIDAWNAYWADGHSTNSFNLEYSAQEGPYGKINAYWKDVFSDFLVDSVVVDLASGNGALSKLFQQNFPELKIKQWLSLDSADTNQALTHSKFSTKKCNIEQLDLSANAIDHFVSIFGVEYAQFDKTLAQIKRCIKGTGTCHFIMHHSDSVISKQSQMTIQAYQALFAGGLFAELNDLSSLDLLKKQLLKRLTKALDKVSREQQDDVKLVGKLIFSILQADTSLKYKLESLSNLQKQLELHLLRLSQQLQAAKQVEALPKLLCQHGFDKYELKELYYQNDIIAWQFNYK